MASPQTQEAYQSQILTSSAEVKKGAGVVKRFFPTHNGTIAIYDNSAGDTSGTKLLDTYSVTAGATLELGMIFQQGLSIVLASSAAGTICFV